MSHLLNEILVGPVALLLNILTQIVIIRVTPRRSVVISFFISFFFAAICLVGYELYNNSDIYFVVTNLIIFVGMAYCYFGIVNGGDTSIRIRMLRELIQYPDGLSIAEMYQIYNAEQILNIRLERLTINGQVILKDGKYYPGKSQLIFVARFFLMLKWLVLGKKHELS